MNKSARRLRVGLLYGGRSAEHEVSVQSARSIVAAIDSSLFDVIPIAVDRAGCWHLIADAKKLTDPDLKPVDASADAEEVALVPRDGTHTLVRLENDRAFGALDVVFPVLHGPFGEDGSVQGLLKMAGIPYVGADILGSAVGMDKDVMKRLLRDAGIPIAAFRAFDRANRSRINYGTLAEELRETMFVKPANLGSSVGISKVHTAAELSSAVDAAFEYDDKIIIEEAVACRELECAVLGNDHPKASIVGEIVPSHDYYSYEAKYVDEHGAQLLIPAPLSGEATERVRDLAVRAFRVLACSGMARVDMFLSADGEVLVNEINTIPGFTRISMYPKLWEAAGLSYTELITTLIELGIERAERENRRKTTRA